MFDSAVNLLEDSPNNKSALLFGEGDDRHE